jgi:hypothetical protein
MNTLILGITGQATAGKDTLYTLLQRKLSNDYVVIRRSLADVIRKELNELSFFKNNKIDLFNVKGAEKEQYRQLMVEYATVCRAWTNGRYFIEKIKDQFEIIPTSKKVIFCITDIRFAEYEKDEVYWIANELPNGKLVYVNRHTIDIDGNKKDLPFSNDQERKQDLALITHSDMFLDWPTTANEEELYKYVNPLITKIRTSWLPL